MLQGPEQGQQSPQGRPLRGSKAVSDLRQALGQEKTQDLNDRRVKRESPWHVYSGPGPATPRGTLPWGTEQQG